MAEKTVVTFTISTEPGARANPDAIIDDIMSTYGALPGVEVRASPRQRY